MAHSDRLLRNTLTVQGLLYLGLNLWALIATPHYIGLANPRADIFEARSFAAISLVTAIFFLVGAWRQDLLRPAAFLGLGMAVALTLVELFHLPTLGWQTVLWLDLAAEIILAGLYIFLFFFRREEAPAPAVETPAATEAVAAPEELPVVPPAPNPEAMEPMTSEEQQSPESHVV